MNRAPQRPHRVRYMSVNERNKRLYEKLRGMGLYVCITSDPDDRKKIDSITVSAGCPKVTLVPCDVGLPLKGAQVGDVVRPTIRNGDNVVDFPTVD